MWEHAEALIGIPEAIRATIDIFEFLRTGRTKPADAARDGSLQLGHMRTALREFAKDALELQAYKKLHKVTNALSTDLRESFTIVVPDINRARHHHTQMLDAIQNEFLILWDQTHAGGQLSELRESPDSMMYLQTFPQSVMEKIPNPPWDKYLWDLLHRTNAECQNFGNFSKNIAELRTINVALNNFADHSISRGIDRFNLIMDQLRAALGRQ